MIRSLLPTASLVFALALPVAATATPRPNGDWVCIHHAHNGGHHEAGKCPICGMDLVRRDELVHAAILVFDEVQIIDYAAPYEVFGQARFFTYLVSPDGGPITTAMNMRVTPHFGIGDAPRPDVLLVPGGGVDEILEDERGLAWVRESAATARHVLSVCNGAFILAEAGLLDGLTATTFHKLLEKLAMGYPEVDVVRGTRFVDNGKIVTSAGLSAGIDGAIHVVEKVQGGEAARKLADHIEYAWDPSVGQALGKPVARKLSDEELHAYDGVYEFEEGGRVTIYGSAEDGILYALVGEDHYPLLPLPRDSDRFLTVSGDELSFVRGESGEIRGYRRSEDAAGALYRRLEAAADDPPRSAAERSE